MLFGETMKIIWNFRLFFDALPDTSAQFRLRTRKWHAQRWLLWCSADETYHLNANN
jgi:hypothetical protein